MAKRSKRKPEVAPVEKPARADAVDPVSVAAVPNVAAPNEPKSPRRPWVAFVVVLAAAVLAGYGISDKFGHSPKIHYGAPTVTSSGGPAAGSAAQVVTTVTTITAP